MPAFTTILLGGQTRALHTEAENALHRASPIAIRQAVHEAEDRAQQAGAGAQGQIGDKVTAVITQHTEAIPELLLENIRGVSAFIADVVPIPYWHGDQPVTEHRPAEPGTDRTSGWWDNHG